MEELAFDQYQRFIIRRQCADTELVDLLKLIAQCPMSSPVWKMYNRVKQRRDNLQRRAEALERKFTNIRIKKAS